MLMAQDHVGISERNFVLEKARRKESDLLILTTYPHREVSGNWNLTESE